MDKQEKQHQIFKTPNVLMIEASLGKTIGMDIYLFKD